MYQCKDVVDLRGEKCRDCSGGCESISCGEQEPGFRIPGKLLVSVSRDRKRRWGNLLSSKFRTMQKCLLLAINPIIFSNILVQSPSGKLFLLFGEPSRGSWEIRDDEEGEESKEDLFQLVFKSVVGNE